jgi:hypothetical protein
MFPSCTYVNNQTMKLLITKFQSKNKIKSNNTVFKKVLSKNYFRMKYWTVPLIEVFDMLINGKLKKEEKNIIYPKSINSYVNHYKLIDLDLNKYKKTDILLISCVNGYIDIVYEMFLDESVFVDIYYAPLIKEYNRICSPINMINPWSRTRMDKLTKDWIKSNMSLKKFPSSQSSLCETYTFEGMLIKAIIYVASQNQQFRLVKLLQKINYENILKEIK